MGTVTTSVRDVRRVPLGELVDDKPRAADPAQFNSSI